MNEKCQYNNSCYETAEDGSYIECEWNIIDNLPAKIKICFTDDGDDREWLVCEGCAIDIEQQCEDNENKEFDSEERFIEKTKSFENRRTVKGKYFIRKVMTQKQYKVFIRKIGKHNG